MGEQRRPQFKLDIKNYEQSEMRLDFFEIRW